jgi:hypothetical protein
MNSTTQIQPVNSLTYADMAGLNLGLSRLGGEDSVAFLKRCYLATTRRRDHSYEGAQDELCLQLGLAQWAGIALSSSDQALTVMARIGLVTVTTLGVTYSIPTVTLDADRYWTWRKLSNVVEDLGAIPGVTAKLLGPDGPALQIANQSNVITVVNEPITAVDQNLEHSNLIPTSVIFNTLPGSYQLDPNAGTLRLISTPPAGLSISYQYIAQPYNLVSSEVGLFGLVEPSLAKVGIGPDNVLAYQLREAVQAIMAADLSYWAN